MTRPAEGVLSGTTRRKLTSPAAARPRTASSSFAPPTVRLATTRTSLMRSAPASLALRSRQARAGADRRRRWCEDAVFRSRHAVLVGAADDRGHAVEVEDR